ncbi:MAG: dienelactone hydrolase family protein [Coriobacteriales bacterium]|nr:dienelactone hydrolase family protein [Coriobacteriales bacterium]
MESSIHVDGRTLAADIELPASAAGLVVFAHGSGSSRLSPRNRWVAERLREDGSVGTLLFDLLTAEEDRDYSTRFDIGLLAERLLAAVEWAKAHPAVADLRLGLFGASTGAAAALDVAAVLGREIRAVVSRGGRPDLAGDALPRVTSPTLLIVGGLDTQVIELNRMAFAQLASPEKRIEIVPGATHLFEEPGTLEEVGGLAADWFREHLSV